MSERTLTPPTEPIRSRIGLRDVLVDSAVITRRNLVRNLRLPQLLVFATIQPVMFLLLFTYVFGGAIGQTILAAAGGRYINSLMPGLLVQIAAFGAGQTALGLTEDLSKGVIDRFRSLPMARSAVLAGRTVADVVRNAFVVTLMLAVAFLIGFRYQTDVLSFLAGVALALAFTSRCRGDGRDRPGREEPGGGPVRGVPPGVPAGVRELGVPADGDDAVVAAGVR
jgi:hypothetical protein